jgi:hypothetical protein
MTNGDRKAEFGALSKPRRGTIMRTDVLFEGCTCALRSV